MRIGLISDLHGHIPASAFSALANCDTILCAGDIESQRMLWELETIAPTVAVRGNCDYDADVSRLPLVAGPKFDGVRFFMVHRPQDIGTPPADVQIVVHGHTHIPRDETVGEIRYLNPGSATYPRGGSQRSCAIITIDDGDIVQVEFITLQ